MRMNIIERIRDDAVFFSSAIRSLRRTLPIVKNPSRLFPFVIDELAQQYGDAPALLSARENFSYRILAERTNKYARWALGQKIEKGDVVGVLMPSRPEFLAIWLGITKVGGIAALLNTNLVGASLAHCIDIVAPKHIIVAAELFEIFAAVQPQLKTQAKVWVHGERAGDSLRIDREIEKFSGDALTAAERRPLTIDDRALYIYTSGTTGMPKAANVNHHRIMLASYGFAGVMNTRRSDRMFDCLPMYHTAGGICAIGSLLVTGGSVVIREKFSAHEFWRDVARHECTLIQYIGELCRYLVNTPPGPHDQRHRVRLACGNGLRPDVWDEFQRRFRIPRIVEFYAATEGNVMLFNFEGKPGAIGRLPPIMARRFPAAIVAFDLDAQQPVRDAQGFCIPCKPGEAGEAIGKIAYDPAQSGGRFDGYADKAEDEQKILRNVFAPGDAWFRTGDLMKQDVRGYFYFVDRTGDTFRWKGENVSASEVAETIGAFPGVAHAIVYGVAVPGHDGRAGMAAIAAGAGFDLAALRDHLTQRLPDYARPLFVRISSEIAVTSTFKPKKTDLAHDGFDPARTRDVICFNDRDRQAFVPLSAALYERICNGTVRL
jgi:fatty-acyl-CoA synthase